MSEPLATRPYHPGGAVTARQDSDYELALVFAPDSSPILGVFVDERDNGAGVCIAFPSCAQPYLHFGAAFRDTTVQARDGFDVDAELAGVVLSIILIDIDQSDFAQVFVVDDRSLAVDDSQALQWEDGNLPLSYALIDALEDWMSAADGGGVPGGSAQALVAGDASALDAGVSPIFIGTPPDPAHDSSAGFVTGGSAPPGPATLGRRGRNSGATAGTSRGTGRGQQARTPSQPKVTVAALQAQLEAASARIADLEAAKASGRAPPGPPTPGTHFSAGHFAQRPGMTGGSAMLRGDAVAARADGYARSRTAGDAALTARDRALQLLPFSSPGVATSSAAPAAEPFRSSPESQSLPADLIAKATAGGVDSDRALRILELQVLQKLANQQSRGSSDVVDGPDALNFGSAGGDQVGGIQGTRGTENIERIRRSMENHPEEWSRAFDRELAESCGSHITGMPWSLHEYVRRQVRFSDKQEDLMRMAYMLSGLHALHRQGPERHARLGVAIDQCVKAVLQAARDRDWVLAWLWTGQPDPKPHNRFGRGLVHPSEYAAGLSHLKEIHTLQQYHKNIHVGGRDGAADDAGGYERGRGRGRGKGRNQGRQQGQQADADGVADGPAAQGRGRGRGR